MKGNRSAEVCFPSASASCTSRILLVLSRLATKTWRGHDLLETSDAKCLAFITGHGVFVGGGGAGGL